MGGREIGREGERERERVGGRGKPRSEKIERKGVS